MSDIDRRPFHYEHYSDGTDGLTLHITPVTRAAAGVYYHESAVRELVKRLQLATEMLEVRGCGMVLCRETLIHYKDLK